MIFVVVFIAFSVIYFIITYILYARNRRKIIVNKTKRLLKTRFKTNTVFRKWMVKHHVVEIIYYGWIYRYSSFDGIFCKIIVIVIGICVALQNFRHEFSFAIFFVLFLILTFTDDNYWKKEITNTIFLKINGIHFYHYFFLNVVSAVFFHIIVVSLMFAIAVKSIAEIAAFIFLAIFLVLYWTIVYIYLYLSSISDFEFAKQLFLFAMLVVEFIPLVNIFMEIYLFIKLKKIWGQRHC
ncbi:hypothetical protein SAMN02910398_00359 [Butyrivibrio sp. YAB3001]|nr:hypothetical protein SAMN02910398_00359 [Butyrivibrio sp. YAB3001]